jgi:hypothetical protein
MHKGRVWAKLRRGVILDGCKFVQFAADLCMLKISGGFVTEFDGVCQLKHIICPASSEKSIHKAA